MFLRRPGSLWSSVTGSSGEVVTDERGWFKKYLTKEGNAIAVECIQNFLCLELERQTLIPLFCFGFHPNDGERSQSISVGG